jgi:DNA-binding transcriptional LysR family regulator
MDYFAALRAFVQAVELGSFSKAAAEQDVKISTVSRYVSALEADLGAALFNRSTRRLHLTEVGTVFHEHAQRILADVAAAREVASALNARPQGLLRVNMPGAFGRRHVVPHLAAFLAEYPEIRVDATLTDQTVDLIASGADVALRIGALADSTLIARRLAPHRRVVVASPAYLAAHGPIAEPGDLQHHDALLFALQPRPAWYFHRPGDSEAEPVEIALETRFRANDSEALLQAALDGLGVALLPSWLAGDEIRSGRLAALLPAWEGLIAPGPERAIWGVYPPKRIVAPKLRVFLEFLERRFGRPPYWDRPAG